MCVCVSYVVFSSVIRLKTLRLSLSIYFIVLSYFSIPRGLSTVHFRQAFNNSDGPALEEGLKLLCIGSRALLLCSSLLPASSFGGIRGGPDKRRGLVAYFKDQGF